MAASIGEFKLIGVAKVRSDGLGETGWRLPS
jgi:hypothetical protein